MINLEKSALAYLLQDQLPTHPTLGQVAKALGRIVLVKNFSTTAFRLSQILGSRMPWAGYAVKQVNHVITGADLAWQATVGRGLVLHHPTGVVWGPGVTLGEQVTVQQGVTIGGRGGTGVDGSPKIESGAEIGAGARVIGPVTVGRSARVGANAVVLADVPAGAAAVGIPARVIERSSKSR